MRVLFSPTTLGRRCDSSSCKRRSAILIKPLNVKPSFRLRLAIISKSSAFGLKVTVVPLSGMTRMYYAVSQLVNLFPVFLLVKLSRHDGSPPWSCPAFKSKLSPRGVIFGLMLPNRRYSKGSLELISGSRGKCWYIRFSAPDGTRPRYPVGLEKQYPTRDLASKAAEYIRDEFNNTANAASLRTFGDVIARYELEEMPLRYSTRAGYQNMLDKHIRPRWFETALKDIDPVEVRGWFRSLNLSPRSKGHILDLMRSLYKFAMFWRWIQPSVNPLRTFSIPGCSKRSRSPRIVSPEDFCRLYQGASDQREKAMLVGAYLLGLRISELLALQWGDFEVIPGRLFVSRAVVDGHVGPVKTWHSEAPLPLHPFVTQVFTVLRRSSKFPTSKDWVFGSNSGIKGKISNHRRVYSELLRRNGESIGLDFRLGWHTLRHSYRTLLDTVGSEPSVQRDLMRHADIRTTMQHYGAMHFSRLQEANACAVDLTICGLVTE